MRVTLLLADAAQVDGAGKAHALGIGWEQTSSPTGPSSVLVLITVPWNETNRKHHLRLVLRDADGHEVMIPTPIGEQPLRIEADFEAGRPPGMVSGTEQVAKLAPMIGPLPLAPGRYEWHADVNGKSQEDWSARFTVIGPATPDA